MPKLRLPKSPVPIGYEIYRDDGKHSAYRFGRSEMNTSSTYVELYFFFRSFNVPSSGTMSEGYKFGKFRWLAKKGNESPAPWFGNTATVKMETGSNGMTRFVYGAKLIEYIVKRYGFPDDVTEESRQYWIEEGDYGEIRYIEPHTLVKALADIGIPRIVEDGRNSGRWTRVDDLLPPNYDLYIDDLDDDTQYARGKAAARNPHEAKNGIHNDMIEDNMRQERIDAWLKAESPVVMFLDKHRFELNHYSIYRPIPLDTKACLLLNPQQQSTYYVGTDYTKWLDEAPTY